jgi:hypothetical protein
MWRFTVLTARKSGTAPGAFQTHWLEVLGPAIAAAAGDRLRRLVVDLPPAEILPEVAEVFPAQFDGMAELWFDGREDAEAALERLAADAKVAAATAPVDRARSVAWLAEVKPKKPEAGRTVVKFLAGGNPAEGWSVEEAQHYWSETHPVVAQTVPHTWNMMTRYVQFHGRELAPRLRAWIADGRFVPLCADMGFATQSDFIRHYTDPGYLATVRPDEQKFSRPGEMLSYVTGEERVLVGA